MSRRFSIFLLITTISFTLVGCESKTKVVEKEVNKYNELVEGTLDSYSKSVAISKKDKDAIIKDLTEDKGIALNDKYGLERLPEEHKEAFKHPMINMDEYYTSIGATATREVILLVGSDGLVMNLILVWSDEGLIDIERRVTGNA